MMLIKESESSFDMFNKAIEDLSKSELLGLVKKRKEAKKESLFGLNLAFLVHTLAASKYGKYSLTQKELSELSGINPHNLRTWSAAGNVYPTYDKVQKVVLFFRRELNLPPALLNTASVLCENIAAKLMEAVPIVIGETTSNSMIDEIQEKWFDVDEETRAKVYKSLKYGNAV